MRRTGPVTEHDGHKGLLQNSLRPAVENQSDGEAAETNPRENTGLFPSNDSGDPTATLKGGEGSDQHLASELLFRLPSAAAIGAGSLFVCCDWQ